MRTKRFIFILLVGIYLLDSAPSIAQVITANHHLPLATDSLLAYKLPYISVTDSGHYCLWDFSGLFTDSAELIDIDYFAPSEDTARIGLHREQANYYYNNVHDTLWMTGHETSRAYMRYSTSIPLLHYPFGYGDSLSGAFMGTGKYCHILPISTEGTCSTHADAIGRLILPDVESDSVLRIHQHMHYHDKTHTHNCVREERYMWFSPYCRYPLLETVYMQTIRKTDTATFAATYYIPQEPEFEPIVREQTEQNDIEIADSLITDVSYLPNPVYNDLQVKYSLGRSARVYISVHYNGGVTTYQTPLRTEEEGEHTIGINMAGMPIGSYVVYIHADDTVVSGNIVKL